jgi:predicted DNA binding CopG/RHH family protein
VKKLKASPNSSARGGSFMKETNRRMPDFKNEDEEREFWASHSPLDFFDAKNFKKASFPNLKPSIKSISIRLPEDLLAELKILANKKDVPYQSLAKVFLARQIVLERESLSRTSRKRKVKAASRSK